MEYYTLNESDFIINTLIEIKKKENRRIIDTIDIENYEKLIIKKAKESNINIIHNHTIDPSMEDFIYTIEDTEEKYVMLPWVTYEDLIEKFRGHLPLDLCIILCDKNIKKEIPIRDKKELEVLNNISLGITNKFTKEIMDIINELERKKCEEEKKLIKIKKISINKE